MITCKNKFGLKETQKGLFFPACLFLLRAYRVSSVGWGLCAGVCLCLALPPFSPDPRLASSPPTLASLPPTSGVLRFLPHPPSVLYVPFPQPRDCSRQGLLSRAWASAVLGVRRDSGACAETESCSMWRQARTLQEGSGRAARTGQGHLLLLGASPASPGARGAINKTEPVVRTTTGVPVCPLEVTMPA